MQASAIKIPGYKTLTLQHLVLDYNGTLAKDGQLLQEVAFLLHELTKQYRVHVITSDTFGSVKSQLNDFKLIVKVLSSHDHTDEKEAYINELGSQSCAAVGNGNNDMKMLKKAELGIALIGEEGCSTQTLVHSDIICKTIEDALDLLLNEKRLIATLRR